MKTSFTRSRYTALLLVLFSLIGAHLSVEQHVRFGDTVVSRHFIAIETNPTGIIDDCWGEPSTSIQDHEFIDHAKDLASEKAIAECLARYPHLKELASFSEIPDDQIAAEIFENTTVKQDRECPYFFELVYRCRTLGDGPEILNHLVKSHRVSVSARLEKEAAKQQAAWIESELELTPDQKAGYRALYTHMHGYRFRALSPSHSRDSEANLMFWAMFKGAAIGFFTTAASIVVINWACRTRETHPTISDESSNVQTQT